MEDLRKQALERSLRRLNLRQLTRIFNYGGEVTHLDKAYDEQTGQFHPIAVGVGVPEIKGLIATEATVDRMLKGVRLPVKPLAGIAGEYYTDHKDRDLKLTVTELMKEKEKEG